MSFLTEIMFHAYIYACLITFISLLLFQFFCFSYSFQIKSTRNQNIIKLKPETLFVWGNERAPAGQEKANTWQGAFPVQNTAADGFGSRAPVGCFEPNTFGLYDMIGNVWEWTETEWSDEQSHVIKGGSFLCAETYCRRYRASARQAQEINFSTNHIGFRTVKI